MEKDNIKDNTKDNKDNKDKQDNKVPVSNLYNLDDALDGFDDNNKLNISVGDDQGDDMFDPKVQEEYEKLMKEMGGEGGLSDLMSNLLSGISPKGGETEGGEGTKEEEAAFQSQMKDILKGFEGGNLEDMANKLLNQFMDKEILQQPLQETKKAYEQVFSNPEKAKASSEDMERYRKQYKVVNEILEQLKVNPSNKDALIQKFQEMQQYGNPPTGINVNF